MRFNEAPSTRASLLRRLQDSNDQRAWATFVEWYKPAIDRWCREKLQAADAEEVCSAVLLKVWNKMPEFNYDPSSRFRGWLRTLVRNAVLDHLRALNRRPGARGSGNTNVQKALEQLEASSDEIPEDGDLDALEAEQERLRQAMQRVQARAESKTWQAWLLTTLQERPAREVADLLGMKITSVYQARLRINKMIEEEYAAAAARHSPGGSEEQQ